VYKPCRAAAAAGLDLLDVLRDMPQFAAGYAYALPGGEFLERAGAAAAARHHNTLGPAGAAAALATHGLALADAVVAAAYRFLARQLAVLSQARPRRGQGHRRVCRVQG